ncbi:MAG: hypothetical protein ACMUIM_00425 [bacterium]
MTERLYKIVFEGEIMEGHVQEEAKKALSRIFQWDLERIDELCSLTPLVIADGVDYQTAMKYNEPFKNAGFICKIDPSEKMNASSVPSPPKDPVTLKAQKDELYKYFYHVYSQAKKDTGRRHTLVMTYIVMILLLISSFMIAAFMEEYVLVIGIGVFVAFFIGIIGHLINKKKKKSASVKAARLFEKYISLEDKENLPLFLAALVTWAENIPFFDHAKEEMLSVCDEIAIVNSKDNEAFKGYLAKLSELDEQNSG